jgi:hypothetical protein
VGEAPSFVESEEPAGAVDWIDAARLLLRDE